MRHERQMEMLDRFANAGPGMAGLHAAESMINPASAYTDENRFAAEQTTLFRDGVVFFAMSCELSEPGQYRTGDFGGIPIAVVRQSDGGLAGLVNACRHRGAPILDAPVGPDRARVDEAGRGGPGLKLLQCPYHAWTYELDGTLKARPASYGAFDDLDLSCDLRRVAVAERHGMVFVRPSGTEPIDLDAILGGMQEDLEAFGMDTLVHVESRVGTWDINWKLVLDTFTEVYHIRTLHQETIAPYFTSDCMVFDDFGLNFAATAFRKNLTDELDKPVADRSVLPYATVQYFVVPNGLIVFQLDHFEVWRVEPIDVRTTKTTTSSYALEGPVDDTVRNHLSKNLDVLLDVIAAEDFPIMTRVQANLDSGALPEVVYGRNEAALGHFHRSINKMLSKAHAA